MNQPTKYEPKQGDVIERGRERLIVGAPAIFHDRFVVSYRRSRFSDQWKPVAYEPRTRIDVAELAAMVNHMGWRVLP